MKKVLTVLLAFLMVFIAAGSLLASDATDTQRLIALLAKSSSFQGLEMTGEVTAFGFPATLKLLQKGDKSKISAETMGMVGFVLNDGVDSYFWLDFDPMVQVIRGGSVVQSFGADYTDPKNSVTYVKTETVNGIECEMYTITAGTKSITLYVSTKYGVLIKSIGKDMDVNIKSIKETTLADSEFAAPAATRYYEVKAFGI